MKPEENPRPPSHPSHSTRPPSSPLPACLRAGLGLLLQAWDYAQELGAPLWDFAVEMPRLWDAGVTSNDVRWLVHKEYVEHAQETTRPGEAGRHFEPQNPLTITPDTSVVLTPHGESAARADLANPAPAATAAAETIQPDVIVGPVPFWDAERRELRLAGGVVKRFRQPARNQETILAAFEELGWPAFMDDPLPQDFDVDPKKRLNKTIENLNRNQRQPLIRFCGDGTGERIGWGLGER